MNNVYFCYPSKTIGGAELLFFRCANYLAKNKEMVIFYIDYIDGYCWRLMDDESINKVEYDDKPLSILPNSVVIVPLSTLTCLDRYIKNVNEIKLLFWSISPQNLTRKIDIYKEKLFCLNKEKRKIVGTRLKKLTEQGVIRYMDYSNYYNCSKVFLFNTSQVDYLPIFVDDFNLITKDTYNRNKSKITFLWLGRLDVDKYFTVVTFINELEDLSHTTPVRLIIIGKGSVENKIKEKAKKCSIEIIFAGIKTGKELFNIIDVESDIGLAMGTSALDIAKRCKPVIVEGFLKKEYEHGQINDYLCLNELQYYDVVSPGYYDSQKGRCFKETFNNILKDYDEFSQKCFMHVYLNHMMSSVGAKLEESIYNLNYDKSSYDSICYINMIIKNNLFWKIKNYLIKFKNKLQNEKDKRIR